MINAKVKIFNEEYPSSLESSINEFLETIDVRQIKVFLRDIKIETLLK